MGDVPNAFARLLTRARSGEAHALALAHKLFEDARTPPAEREALADAIHDGSIVRLRAERGRVV